MALTAEGTTKEQFYARMKNHIQAIVTRYKDVVYCWDVVNEAMSDDPNATDPYRQSAMYRLCGDEFIEKAFQYAHEADPKALLFYNDYSTVDPHKRDRIYNMVKKMKAKGIPIDGIGMQAHYNIYYPSEARLDSAITLFKSIVKHIHITEFDIRVNEEMGGGLQFSREGANVTDSVKQHLADQYARCFKIFRKHKDVIDCVTFWNLGDRDSWLGARNYPLPWDENYQPKLAYEYIRDMKAPKWDMPKRPARQPRPQGGFGQGFLLVLLVVRVRRDRALVRASVRVLPDRALVRVDSVRKDRVVLVSRDSAVVVRVVLVEVLVASVSSVLRLMLVVPSPSSLESKRTSFLLS